jgi:hypothetical protein
MKQHVTTHPNLDIGVKEKWAFQFLENAKPSLPLKLQRHHKCGNTTK